MASSHFRNKTTRNLAIRNALLSKSSTRIPFLKVPSITIARASGDIHSIRTESSKLDSSLKRHTALIKRIRQSVASDNRDQILKDTDSLSLEKYVDEIAGAIVEGISRCKTEKDVWSAVEVSYMNLLLKYHFLISLGYFCTSPSISLFVCGSTRPILSIYSQ